MQKSSSWPFIAILTLAGASAATATFRHVQESRSAHGPRAPIAVSTGTTAATLPASAIRDSDIAFYERRVTSDPESAIDFGLLAGLYMERGRATGSFNDFSRAERLARRSLSLRTARNAQTFGLLASALLARHAFPEALAAAKRAVELTPGVPGPLAQLAEIELEMGDYTAANEHFAEVWVGRDQFTVAARVARWHEIMGRKPLARQLLEGAVRSVDARDDLPREQAAWFHYRLGDLELRSGRLGAADSSFRQGLAIFPDDYRILSGLARIALARHEWTTAVALGDRATALVLDPATLGTISEAYAALGDTVQAGQYAQAMTASALQQPGPIHRAWGLFLLDHGNAADARRVLAKTRVEMRTRKDVYGYDLLAWALHRTGQHRRAADAMQQALAQHTEDGQLSHHAELIERALGDKVAVR